MKTILCTVDFSSSSRTSLLWAVSMARQLRAHLSILHTYRLIQNRSGEIVEQKKILEQEARHKFEQLERECLKDQGISYDFKIEVGFTSDRIEDHARKNPFDFVVIERNKRTNSETFEELIEHIHVPMLLVP